MIADYRSSRDEMSSDEGGEKSSGLDQEFHRRDHSA